MTRPAVHLARLAVAVGLLAPGHARADAPPANTWWIEAKPWSCARFLGPIARAVQAACDAGAGTCALAPTEGSASHRLILFCEDAQDSWRVSVERADHQPLWSTSFDGETGDRLAAIGRFVAHEGEHSPRLTRVAEEPASFAVTPLAFSPQELPPPTTELEEPPRAHEGGLSLDVSYGVINLQAHVRAIHGVVAFSHGAAKLGLALGYAETAQSSVAVPNVRQVQAGAVVALGAPWDTHFVGCALEVGAAIWQSQGQDISPSLPPPQYGPWAASPYAQWTMVFQVPVEPVRPWFGTSALFEFNEFGTATQTFSVVGGVAWNAW
jgi:hypothetical protein